MYEMKKCALCGEEKEIQLSHIIPKFIGRHLKKTSVGNIRSTEDPNKTVQDLEKHYLLCHDCEERFSASERWFANNVFYPWKKDQKTEFEYNSYFHYFITSLSWRSLYLDIMNYVRDGDVDVQKLQIMIDAEKKMKDYLLGKKKDIGGIENHVLFFERIEKIGAQCDDAFYLNPHMRIHRSVSSYTHYSDDTVFTISNLMGIVLVTLYEKGNREIWDGTKIEKGEGKIIVANQSVTSVIGNEFKYWMKLVEEQQDKISDAQKQKIVQRIKDIGEDIKNYDMYQDFLDDRRIQEE